MIQKKILLATLFLSGAILLSGCSHVSQENKEVLPVEEGMDEIGEEEAIETYSLAEVNIHNTASDCWTAFQGKVYDITDFIPEHPAGAEKASKACGQDISGGFLQNPMHESKGQFTLEDFYLGELSE